MSFVLVAVVLVMATSLVPVRAAASRGMLSASWAVLMACSATGPAYAQAGDEVLPPMLSRCAGKAGGDARHGDPAFVMVALDGRPWMTIERTEATVGTQPISTTVTGTGWRQRRDGTAFPFRFTCVLDGEGQAVMFHASSLLRDLGDRLPPSIVVNGTATYADNTPLPKGVELQVQLLDASQHPARVLAEQVVRSGWRLPIVFALRVPTEVSSGDADRRLSLSARLVLAHRTLFELVEARTLRPVDLHGPVTLTLVRASAADR